MWIPGRLIVLLFSKVMMNFYATLLFYRGAEFRTQYGDIGEVRSLVPNTVHLMALTATLKQPTLKRIMNSLCMDKDTTCVVYRSPNKTNIRYEVYPKPTEIDFVTSVIVKRVKEHGLKCPKTIIFCRSYRDLTEVSTSLISQLFTSCSDVFYAESCDGILIPICEMYSSATDSAVKNKILSNFTDPNGLVRIVVATIAFGLGIDAPDVRYIINWGPSDSIEAYIQETGRAGRDSLDATATLYYNKSDVSNVSTVSDDMKVYCGNSGLCRRKLLLKEFTPAQNEVELPKPVHKCCDICALECDCDVCCPQIHITEEEIVTWENDSELITVSEHPSKQLKQKVELALTQYRECLCKVGTEAAPLFFGKELTSGICNSLISQIADSCTTIKTSSQIIDMGLSSSVHAAEVFDIVQQIVDIDSN